MLEGRIDVAVHSAKDMPTETPHGLEIVAFTEREDVRDVFVGSGTVRIDGVADVPVGAVVGTSSLRRGSQLLALRPDLDLVDIRGNVQTRLRKLADTGMTGTVLAAAGLVRLGRMDLAAFAFSLDEMLPAAGQGSLAVEARAGDERVNACLRQLNHATTCVAVRAERSLVRALQGGCQVPIAAYADITGGQLRLRAFVGSVDGIGTLRDESMGQVDKPEALGRDLAAAMLGAGAGDILEQARPRS